MVNGGVPIRKCVVIIESWDHVSDAGSIEAFLENLTLKFGTGSVDVQDLNGDEKHPKQIRCTDYLCSSK
jgi:hypothetical protein